MDSFICYVLVKSNLEIEVRNNNGDMFRLERVNSGSSQLLLPSKDAAGRNSQQQQVSPVLNLYSLKLARQLDREIRDVYELSFRILNENSPSSVLKIMVTDVNDNAPEFGQTIYKFEIVENNSRKSCIGVVQASDKDLGINSRIRYGIMNESLVAYRTIGHEVYQIGKNVFTKRN